MMKLFLKNISKIALLLSLSFVGVFAFAQEQATDTLDAYVIANWDNSSINVVNSWPQDPEEGFWFYQLASDDLVFRNTNQPVYLTFKRTGSNTQMQLCEFAPGPASFSVSYPSCATGSQNTPQIQNEQSPFAPSQQYLVYFTDSAGNNISDNEVGAGQYVLPQIPGPELPINIVSVEESVVAHPGNNGGQYYQIAVTISDTVPNQSLNFRLRSGNTGVFVEPDLGSLPIVQGLSTLPTEIPAQPLLEGNYELVVQYGGQNIEVIPLEDIGGDSSGTNNNSNSNNTGSTSGGIFTQAQEDLLSGGLVPDCGYDIRTQANPNGAGRTCGLADLVLLIQNIIEYIFILILPIAAIIFVYVGFLFLTSGGNADKKNKAKKAITSLVIGILIVLAAWLVVKSVVVTIGVDEPITNQFINLDS